MTTKTNNKDEQQRLHSNRAGNFNSDHINFDSNGNTVIFQHKTTSGAKSLQKQSRNNAKSVRS